MKLIRFGNIHQEKPGLLNEHQERVDLSDHFKDWDADFFANNGLENLIELVKRKPTLPKVDASVRWGACVARPYKLICIGLNYSDHAAESGMKIPEEPIVFMKATNTMAGPYDPVLIPKNSSKTDWEVELAVVIKKEASYLSSCEESKKYIAGYCIANDVSERSFQLERGGQWTKGKSCQTFNPLGPYLATTDEGLNIHNLKMELKVNEVVMQRGNTDKMIFTIDYIIHYLSQFMVLEAGDVICTGTPPGVGMGQKPPRYLKNNDVVELSIEGLGHQKQTFLNSW